MLNLGDKILSAGCRVEDDANLNKLARPNTVASAQKMSSKFNISSRLQYTQNRIVFLRIFCTNGDIPKKPKRMGNENQTGFCKINDLRSCLQPSDQCSACRSASQSKFRHPFVF